MSIILMKDHPALLMCFTFSVCGFVVILSIVIVLGEGGCCNGVTRYW